jgi:hypothetical protein
MEPSVEYEFLAPGAVAVFAVSRARAYRSGVYRAAPE